MIAARSWFVRKAPKLLCGERWSSNRIAVDRATTAKPLSEMPTPMGALPFLGHQLLLREHRQKISQLYYDLSKQFGPIFKIKLPAGNCMVIVCDPKAAEVVFRNEGQYPTRVPTVADNMKWLLKKRGLPIPFVFLSGKEWKRIRLAHNKQILPSNVYSYAPGMNKIASRLMKNLKQCRNEQGYVSDVGRFLSNFAMEASGYFALGANLDLGSGDDPESRAFQHAVGNFITSVGEIALSLPLYRLLPTPLYHRASSAIDDFYNLGKKYLDRNMEKIQESLQKGETLKGQSLVVQWMLEKQMSEAEIILSAVAMFGAGVDTTAHTGTFMLYELSKHPEVQEKLRREVVSVLGESGEADAESLQKMPYLIQVIRETQRVYPVSPKLARTLETDVELLGYHIPAGTIITYSGFTVTKNEEYFREPHKFNPDRWYRGSGSESIHPFALLPFGFGPRACWGRRFSEVELKILLTHVCRKFILESDDAPEFRLPITEKNIIRPGIPVKINFTDL